MNVEAKEYTHADKAERHELAAALKQNYKELKVAMHESVPSTHSYEEEDSKAAVVTRVLEEVQSAKSEIISKAVSESDRAEARSLANELEERSEELRNAAKHERKHIAKQMQSIVHKMKDFEAKMEAKESKKQAVFRDIDNIESGLPSRHLSKSDSVLVKDELEGIRREVSSSHPDKEAIHERMDVLKTKLHDDDSNQFEEVAATPSRQQKLNKVLRDLDEAEDKVNSADVTSSAKAEMIETINSLRHDAKKLVSTPRSSSSHIKSALNKNVEYLHRQFEENGISEDDDEVAEVPKNHGRDFEEEDNDNDFNAHHEDEDDD